MLKRLAGVSVVGMCAAGALAMAGCNQRLLIGNVVPLDGVAGYGGSSGAGGTPGTTCPRISTAVNVVNPCGPAYGIAYSADGTLLATGNITSPTGGVHIWRLSDGALLHELDGIPNNTYEVAFSPDAQTLAAVGMPDSGGVTAKLYDVGTGALIRTLPTNSGMYSSAVAFSPDGSLIATGGFMGAIELWRASDGTLVLSIPYLTGSIHNVHFSPTGAQLIVGGTDQRATVWNIPAGTLALTLTGIAGDMADVNLSPDGRQFASTSGVGSGVRVWDAASGALLQTMDGFTTNVGTAVWIGNDRIVGGDWYGKMISWTRASDGSFQQSRVWNTGGQIIDIAVAPDQTRVATAAGAGFEFIQM
jgi:WD40 repeat protein